MNFMYTVLLMWHPETFCHETTLPSLNFFLLDYAVCFKHHITYVAD